ncbi:MAG: sulfatase [Polaribacter sp.]
MYLAYNAPHAPLQATEKYLSRYPHIKNKNRKTYAAMVSAVDDGVGLILAKLKELNIEENTIVFFLSDNGGNENKGSYNGQLKKGKGSLYEGGIRVPFAMQWKGKIPAGMVYENPIISLDIFATAAKYAQVSPKNKLDGVNLIPFLTGENKGIPHGTLYWRMFDKQSFAIRKNNIKLIKNNKGEIGLYDLSKDIAERNGLNDSIFLKKLKNLHNRWNSLNINPIFDGLKQNKSYNLKHPDRFNNVEKY